MSKSSIVPSGISGGRPRATPALANAMSMLPCSATMPSTSDVTASASLTSSRAGWTRAPATARARERRGRLVQALGVPVRDDHDRAAIREDLGERVAQARGAPGDKRHLVAHVEQRGEHGAGAVLGRLLTHADRFLLKKRSRVVFGIVTATTSAAP